MFIFLDRKFEKAKFGKTYPVSIYMFKVNRNPRTRCEICSKSTIKTPERRQ